MKLEENNNDEASEGEDEKNRRRMAKGLCVKERWSGRELGKVRSKLGNQ